MTVMLKLWVSELTHKRQKTINWWAWSSSSSERWAFNATVVYKKSEISFSLGHFHHESSCLVTTWSQSSISFVGISFFFFSFYPRLGLTIRPMKPYRASLETTTNLFNITIPKRCRYSHAAVTVRVEHICHCKVQRGSMAAWQHGYCSKRCRIPSSLSLLTCVCLLRHVCFVCLLLVAEFWITETSFVRLFRHWFFFF